MSTDIHSVLRLTSKRHVLVMFSDPPRTVIVTPSVAGVLACIREHSSIDEARSAYVSKMCNKLSDAEALFDSVAKKFLL